jgi:hypothetical protein
MIVPAGVHEFLNARDTAYSNSEGVVLQGLQPLDGNYPAPTNRAAAESTSATHIP